MRLYNRPQVQLYLVTYKNISVLGNISISELLYEEKLTAFTFSSRVDLNRWEKHKAADFLKEGERK